jgi:hypothetical protein
MNKSNIQYSEVWSCERLARGMDEEVHELFILIELSYDSCCEEKPWGWSLNQYIDGRQSSFNLRHRAYATCAEAFAGMQETCAYLVEDKPLLLTLEDHERMLKSLSFASLIS